MCISLLLLGELYPLGTKTALLVLPPGGLTTPLMVSTSVAALKLHPDQLYVSYVLKGIQSGFRIRFDYANHRCRQAGCNMASATANPESVGKYLQAELKANRIVQIHQPCASSVHCSHFGVIPRPTSPAAGNSSWSSPVQMAPVSTTGSTRT